MCSTYPNDLLVTLGTRRSEVLSIVVLTEQFTCLFYKAALHQGGLTVRVSTDEMIGAPGGVQCQHKRTSTDTQL